MENLILESGYDVSEGGEAGYIIASGGLIDFGRNLKLSPATLHGKTPRDQFHAPRGCALVFTRSRIHS